MDIFGVSDYISTEEIVMATAPKLPVEDREDLQAKPRPDTDRAALRKLINERYSKTLAYLGR